MVVFLINFEYVFLNMNSGKLSDPSETSKCMPGIFQNFLKPPNARREPFRTF